MELTLEERERIAYIEGRTEEAKLLALLIDAQDDAHCSCANDEDDGE